MKLDTMRLPVHKRAKNNKVRGKRLKINKTRVVHWLLCSVSNAKNMDIIRAHVLMGQMMEDSRILVIKEIRRRKPDANFAESFDMEKMTNVRGRNKEKEKIRIRIMKKWRRSGDFF